MTENTHPATPSVVVVSGNPREGSRTLAAAQAAGRRVAELLGAADITTIELGTFAGEILTATHPAADAAKERLARATVAVVATPVYKASYTGLLKAFLDLYGPDGLAGVVVVPVVVSGNPAHALAGEAHLRPVLVELGAVVPTRTLSLTEAQLPQLGEALDPWFARWATPLRRAAGVLVPSSLPASDTATAELTGAAR
ncbi:NAD(P)H-dependent oxidoreductase [Isoptericola sp. NPDC019482]|uniref:NADPH-dependent FMN reductase n=1 Tax=Isoptericola sp. NPDC019482 TaxID=3154688 RepID=UPI003495E45C